jgi:hypothetical protein
MSKQTFCFKAFQEGSESLQNKLLKNSDEKNFKKLQLNFKIAYKQMTLETRLVQTRYRIAVISK